jgi:hypothetical protein
MNTSGLAINSEYLIPGDLEPTNAPTEPFSVQAAKQSNISTQTWPPQLVFDLALGLEGYEEIELRHGISKDDLEKLYNHTVFRREVANLTRELRESNKIFRAKAKTQAEFHLETMNDLMSAPETPASTKLAIFQTLAKYGELEPVVQRENTEKEKQEAQVVIRIESNVRLPEVDITPKTLALN